MAAALLVAGSILLAIGGRSISDEWRLARNGVSTDGTVLTKQITPARNYEATYRFMVPEGVFENRSRLSYAEWSRLKERDAVEVLYIPKRPSTNRLAGAHQWIGTTVVALLGCVCLAAGAISGSASRRQ